MSIKLYHGNNFLTAGRRVEILAEICGVDIQNIRIANTEWKGEAHLKRNPFGKIPGMQTPEGNLFESLALMRYIARKAGKMYGNSPIETAQIDQWLEFFNTQFMPAGYPIIRTAFGYSVVPKQKFDDAIREMHEFIKIIQAALKDSPFLGSKQLNIADIALGIHWRPLMRLFITQQVRSANPNFTKWFNQVNSHPVVMKKFGKAWLCQKQFVPDFTFGKEAPKKQAKKEQPKKEQQNKEQVKKEQPKKEQPKKEQPKKQKKEQVLDDQPKVEKKKNPLDELPPSPFNIDDWKREFCNAEDTKASIKQFWNKFDPVGWSIWKLHYVRYEGEGKVGYLTANLKNGYLRNIDHFRRYCFSVLGVYGVEGDYNIDGVWLWRGTQIPEEWKEHQSYEYFEFTKLDHTNDQHRKMTEEYWTCLEEGDMVDGHPVFEAKWFK